MAIKYRVREHPEGTYTVEMSGGDEVWVSHETTVCVHPYRMVWRTGSLKRAKRCIEKLKAKAARYAINRVVHEE